MGNNVRTCAGRSVLAETKMFLVVFVEKARNICIDKNF